jgi:hypothetical protein
MNAMPTAARSQKPPSRWLALLIGLVLLCSAAAVTWHLLADGLDRMHPRRAGVEPVSAAQVGDGAGNLSTGARPVADTSERPPQTDYRGRILLPDGRPAPAVAVTVYRQLSAWPEWRKEPTDSVTTGADGSFQFPVDAGDALLLGYERDGYVGDLVPISPHQSDVELRLHEGIEVGGTVTDPFGRGVAGAEVVLESTLVESRRVRRSGTAVDGSFRFASVAPGMARVVARHPSYAPAMLPAVVVGADQRLDLRFRGRGVTLSGTVLDAATQRPIAMAEVLALTAGQDVGRHQPVVTRTDGQGRFQLEGLGRGNVTLECRHSAHASVRRTLVVSMTPAQVTVELPARARLSGVLVAQDELMAGLEGSHLVYESSVGEILTTLVGPDGAFLFAGSVTPGWGTLMVPDGRFSFARSGSSRQRLQAVEESDLRELELEIVHSATVVGSVVDDRQDPVVGAEVSVSSTALFAGRLARASRAFISPEISAVVADQLARAQNDSPDLVLAVTDGDGRFSVKGLAPGQVTLQLRHVTHGRRLLAVGVPELGRVNDVGPLVMQNACVIRGVVRRGGVDGKGLAGAQVSVTVDGEVVRVVTGPDGAYELRDLPPGSYRVRARYSTVPSVTAPESVDASPGSPQTVDLVFPGGRQISGAVLGVAGQPVEGAIVMVRGAPGQPVLTDASGGYRLEVGEQAVELEVVYDGTSRDAREVPRDVDVADFRIDAPPNSQIRARVLGLPGRQLLAGVLLRMQPLQDGPGTAAPNTRWVPLDGGLLRYPWFPAGSWQVELRAEGFVPHIRIVEAVAAEEVDLGDVLLEPGCSLVGRVVDDAGEPVVGAHVWLGEEADFELHEPRLRSDADGRFALTGVSTRTPWVCVRSPDHAWSRTEVRLPQDVLRSDPLEIRLRAASTIVVDLGDIAGVEDAIIVLSRAGRVVETAVVGGSSEVVFRGYDVGDYEVKQLGDDLHARSVVVERPGSEVQVELGRR